MAIRVSDLLVPRCVIVSSDLSSRKRALEMLSELIAAAREPLSQRLVFDQLCARERLGSTGLGHGVALPHARVPGLGEACGAFVRASDGIDFDAPDGARVDLGFGLVVPEEYTDEHIKILAMLARLLSAATLRESLRRAHGAEEIFTLLAHEESDPASP